MQCRYGQTFLYHRNYGHTTEGFQVLKDKIEEIVQADGLVSLGVPVQEVNYIAGGFAGGGCSTSARKKHIRAI